MKTAIIIFLLLVTGFIASTAKREKIQDLFFPSWLVPTVIIAVGIILETLILRGDTKITEFLAVNALVISAWIHFLHRRKIWKRALQDDAKRRISNRVQFNPHNSTMTILPREDIPPGRESQIDYLTDFLHLDNAIQDRKRDKSIETVVAKFSLHKDTEYKGTGDDISINLVLTIEKKQTRASAITFLRRLDRYKLEPLPDEKAYEAYNEQSYYAIIMEIDKDKWSVAFPDFPSCEASGKTSEEATKNAKEIFEHHIRDMRKKGEQLPVPLDAYHIMALADSTPLGATQQTVLLQAPSEEDASPQFPNDKKQQKAARAKGQNQCHTDKKRRNKQVPS